MHVVVLVLCEILIVIGLSRLVGLTFRWINQPLVIGEIIAGIILGPSLLGMVAPGLAATLFPPEAIPFLNVLAQVGLIFFMFLIGLDISPKYLIGNLEIAILTSHISILVPLCLGILLAFILYPLVSTSNVPFTAFALFLGATMSITAFPMLVRIITENNLQRTRLGILALKFAVLDDITAWCILAVAIAVTRNGGIDQNVLLTIFESIVYISAMLTVGRWFLKLFSNFYERAGGLSQVKMAFIYGGVVTSALITEYIGIHLIFGAFLFGAIVPKNEDLVSEIAVKTQDFVLIFLLPIFFAYSGLKTQIGLINSPQLWGLFLLVLVVGILGKYTGTYIAARIYGINNREASALGWLMNTRGLTELIVFNIGLELKIISPLLFTMLVIMVLVTTFMTSPLLELTYPKDLIRKDIVEPETDVEISNSKKINVSSDDRPYRILVPVANPTTQRGLLNLATAIAFNHQKNAIVNPLSLIELPEDYAYSTLVETERLIRQRLIELEDLIYRLDPETRFQIQPIARITNDVARETTEIAAVEQADLILLGWHRPAFSSNRLGGRVGQILTTANVDVAVYIDRGQENIERILVPFSANIHDDLAVILALRLLVNKDTCTLTILQVVTDKHIKKELSYEVITTIEKLPLNVRERIHIETVEAVEPIQAVVAASEGIDLTIAGTSRAWGIERQTLGRYTDHLAIYCRSSLLITRRYSQVSAHLTPVLVDMHSSVAN
ncbi:MAG: cation:proton antiporter [Calothrix sp. C42_A2020_038]|nr:cation:proton antiporter [Calothrix sp. C42_A2020_038]